MRPGGGKGKGAAFERKICAMLSLWVTKGKKKDVFWRSSMSGGRATIHVRKGDINRQAGDIASVTPEGHQLTDAFFIECKHVRDLAIGSFFLQRIGKLEKFWKKCVYESGRHERWPMLIACQNRQPIIVLTTATTVTRSGCWTHRARNVKVTRLELLLRKPFATFIHEFDAITRQRTGRQRRTAIRGRGPSKSSRNRG